MAVFTDDDKRVLDILRKALLERKAGTLPSLAPWQEILGQQTSVLSDRGAVPADVVRGLAGSWASSYSLELGASVVSSGASDSVVYIEADTNPVRAQTSRLGKFGVPEINFPPFNARTNAFGPKGPALIGHPISFEVQGPTLKSPACDWTWEITLGAGPNGGDLFTMSTRADGGVATCSTVASAYNIPNFTIADLNEPNGGTYLVITDDGTSPGSLPVAVTALPSLSGTADFSRTEIFRVSNITGASIEIHPNKPLRRVFNVLVGTFGVRGIMLLRPFATRLAALPSQVRGREQNFVIVSPTHAASGDLYPPLNGGTPGDGTWLQGGFTELTAPGSGNAVGTAVEYMGRQALPIPVPVDEFAGEVEFGAGLNPGFGVGIWQITLAAPPPITLIGKIIRVYQTSRVDVTSVFRYGSDTACLGFFEVQTIVGNDIALVRVAEPDPINGRVFYGPGPYIQQGVLNERVLVYFSVYRPLTELFTGALSMDDVEACRLAPLLSPTWVERGRKQRGAPAEGLPPGSSRSKPDRAVFDTRTFIAAGGKFPEAADPGNLLDLGFRMVLFPAKLDPGSGQAIPDFTSPITSREVRIDPSVAEAQYVDIDYDAGLIRLSHPPPAGAGGDVVPNGIVGLGTNNPRGEVVLFACAVPYSTEESQRGMGPSLRSEEGVFSPRIEAAIDTTTTTFVGVSPFFGFSGVAPNPVEIVLDRIWQGPPTGIVEVVEGGFGGRSFGSWAYTGFRNVLVGGVDVSALSLPAANPLAIQPAPGVGTGETRCVILRREVEHGTVVPTNAVVTDDYIADRGYGIALRATSLRLPRAQLKPSVDGSLELRPPPNISGTAKTLGYMAPSKMPFPPRDPGLVNPVDSYFGESGLFGGLDYQVEPADPRAPTPGGPFRSFPEGSCLEISTQQPAPNWHGVITAPEITADGIVRVDQGFRLTCRFKLVYRGALQQAAAFIGFAQDENGGGALAPTIADVTSFTAMNARFSAVGLFVLSGPVNGVFFWARGSDGFVATDFTFNTGLAPLPANLIFGPYTLVLETTPSAPIGVRIGLFDDQNQLVRNTRFTRTDRLPSFGPLAKGLFFAAGVRGNDLAPPFQMHLYHAALTQRFGSFDLPMLP